jgi:hypothetical protein
MYKDFDKNDIDAIQKFYDIFSNYNIVDWKMDIENIIY